MRVLICGDRNYINVEAIRSWLTKLQDWGYDTVIEGGAKGADTIAMEEAARMNFNISHYPAKWEEYKKKFPIQQYGMNWKSAGTDRNTQMLDEGRPDLVIAFHTNIEKSKGTKNMIKQAKARNIKVILVDK